MAMTAAERARNYRARKAIAAGKATAFSTTIICLWCGATATGKRPDAIFCSDACAKASNRAVMRSDFEGGDTAAAEAAEAVIASLSETAFTAMGWGCTAEGGFTTYGAARAATATEWMAAGTVDWFWDKAVDHGLTGEAISAASEALNAIEAAIPAARVARAACSGFEGYAAAVKAAAARAATEQATAQQLP